MKLADAEHRELREISRSLARAVIDLAFISALDMRRYDPGSLEQLREVWRAEALATEALRAVRTLLHHSYWSDGVNEAAASLGLEPRWAWQTDNHALPARWQEPA